MTLEQFAKFIGNTARAKLFYPHLVKYMAQYEINTPKRVRAFLAQAAYESWGFSTLIENTNYKTPESLLKTFPKRVSPEKAKQLAGKPIAIANYVYANRLGNGNEASGDGYKYRGRSIFQLTGKDWYTYFGKDTVHDAKKFVDRPELLSTESYACQAACWFWKINSCSKYADVDDFEGLTRRINGGLNGYDDHDRTDLDSRVDWWERAKKIFI